ncbi:AlpA family transcriptional regulator [Undibacterium sp. RTI2.1]|uniref:helix-turn-helix transcriptional regulator n=1 Tax=unclassified Undibacterium TaxID=2630295 RepID=UPI002B232131|nr:MULTISPECIES: AlpA family transcriptional regulator [unclassified Undibacterium]MEB0030191.1 AlpA family transcriptional regulator [Undibacterium sp. RTI2.1]MEB0116815.1 AlpA family transcriptional regulator [Undibacterium sp. RTI2.2]
MTTHTLKKAEVLPKLNSTCSISDDSTLILRQLGKALQILRMKQLVQRTQLSRATLYVLMSTDKTFPQKIKLSARTVGYLESDVDAWIAARAESCLNVQ